MNYKTLKYRIEGTSGSVSHDLATRFWKTKYHSIEKLKPILNPYDNKSGQDLLNYIESIWDDIKPIEPSEVLEETNIEKRRVYISAFGAKDLLDVLDAKLIDKQVVDFENTVWDKDGSNPKKVKIKDTYELYVISINQYHKISIVRCWCTTTNREYFIYTRSGNSFQTNALDAITSTIVLPTRVDGIKKIYRHGDVFLFDVEEDATMTFSSWLTLTGEQYFNLLTAQS